MIHNIRYIGSNEEIEEAKKFLESLDDLSIQPENIDLTAIVEIDHKIIIYPTSLYGRITSSGPHKAGINDPTIGSIDYNNVKGHTIITLNTNPIVGLFRSVYNEKCKNEYGVLPYWIENLLL